MEYKVIPFVAAIDRNKNAQIQVASQLENLIQNYSNQGWDYVRLESVTSHVLAVNGCFGIGAKPGYTTHRQMVVLRKR